MAKSNKSVGVNSSLLDDAAQWAEDTYEDAKQYFSSPDKGTLVDKLQNRDRDVAEVIKNQTEGTTGAAPKPKPKTPQTKNKQLAADEAKSKKLSKAQVEAIRKKLQSGGTAKVEDY